MIAVLLVIGVTVAGAAVLKRDEASKTEADSTDSPPAPATQSASPPGNSAATETSRVESPTSVLGPTSVAASVPSSQTTVTQPASPVTSPPALPPIVVIETSPPVPPSPTTTLKATDIPSSTGATSTVPVSFAPTAPPTPPTTPPPAPNGSFLFPTDGQLGGTYRTTQQGYATDAYWEDVQIEASNPLAATDELWLIGRDSNGIYYAVAKAPSPIGRQTLSAVYLFNADEPTDGTVDVTLFLLYLPRATGDLLREVTGTGDSISWPGGTQLAKVRLLCCRPPAAPR